MTKKLAVIGGSYLQLPLVLKAKEMGVETHCFAWRDGAVCADVANCFYPISIVEKEEILSVCRKIEVNGITTIASDTAVVTVNHVASHLNLVANPDKYTEITTNKYKMRECFLTHNIPSPKFVLINNKGQSHPDLHFPLIVKPTDRSGSKGVQKISDPMEFECAIERAINESFEGKAIVEEFVAGKEVSVESISWEGKHYILQITDKVTTGDPFFVELEHHQPSSLPKYSQNKIKTIVTQALDALHITFGASHSELKITEDGDIKVIEIGARMGGDFIGSDLVQLSTGYDFLRGVVEIALGKFNKPVIAKHYFSGIYFLSEERKNMKNIIDNWHKYPEIVKAKITNTELHRVSCSGDRSGYLIYLTESKTEADYFKQNMQSIL